MSVWTENLAVLQLRFAELARRLGSVSASSMSIRAMQDARVLAGRWLSGRRIRDGALIAVSGFGDGVHVRTLLSVIPPRTRVFVAEASLPNLRSILDQVDLRDVLGDPRLLLGAGEIDDAFMQVLPSEHAMEMTDVEPWIFSPSFNAAPAYYARFFTEFARFVDFRRKLEGTRVVDAALWQTNSFANLAALADAPELPALAELFRGRPMVLVSAGPSLDESLEFLRAASEVAVIVTVNSSYRAVRNAGIVPHIVMAADPREFTARGFAGIPVDGTWLVTTPIVNPEVVRIFAGRAFIWSGGNELFLELRRRLGLKPGIRIVEQGTVSASAVDLAIILGCDRLCMVGQDLAVRADGRSHAEDSFYSDLNANKVETSLCRRLPGNTLSEVLVEEKLYIYLKTFEQLAAHRPQVRMRNTSRLGARIEGVPYIGFDEALRWLGTKSAKGATHALEKRFRAGGEFSLGGTRVRSILADVGGYAREILGFALRAAAAAEALPEDVLGEFGAERAEVIAAIKAFDSLAARAESDPSGLAILESGRTRMELFRASRFETRLPGDLREHARRLLVGRERAWALAEGAWFLLNQPGVTPPSG